MSDITTRKTTKTKKQVGAWSEESPPTSDTEVDVDNSNEKKKTMRTTSFKSVTDFDRSIFDTLKNKKMGDCDINEHCMYLIAKGEKDKNPILTNDITFLMKKLNRERFNQQSSPRRGNSMQNRHGGQKFRRNNFNSNRYEHESRRDEQRFRRNNFNGDEYRYRRGRRRGRGRGRGRRFWSSEFRDTESNSNNGSLRKKVGMGQGFDKTFETNNPSDE